jgi:nucleoside-diphosphate-sugar epimerase
MPVRSIIVTGAGVLADRATALLQDSGVRVVGSGDPSADTLVHLDWVTAGPREAPSRRNVDVTRRALDATENSAVSSVVLLSSAIVYGAWPDNPVPLTEDAPLRPNPGIPEAVQQAEAERLVATWSSEHPDASVAILRPATIVGPGVDSWLAQALGGRGTVRPDRADPDEQFVHVDDVAAAVALAVRERLDGVYNVAPNGSVPGEMVRELSAWRPSVPVPGWLGRVAARWGWALRLSSVPPAVLPLVEYPWVVASDRLQAAGWAPQYTSEEAIVAGRPPSRWREMSPGRRQSVALGATGLAAVGIVGAVVVAIGRARYRRHVA